MSKGFTQSMNYTVICRFRYEDIKVDVMSTKEIGWAPSNRWFAHGYENAFDYSLKEETIRLMPLPYFLGTKLEAFFDRGVKDLYASHDFEDIVYLFNYCSTIADQILSTEKNLKKYLVSCLLSMRDDPNIMAAMPGHLYFEETTARMEIIMERINKIIDGNLP
jgi:Gpi18-like mannosyltransferase